MSLHIITLTVHLTGTETAANISLRKSWDLCKSPFWTKYLEGAPSERRVAYPILPYPKSVFRNIFLKEGTHFDFESGYFVEDFVNGSKFQREIQVNAQVKTVMIRHGSENFQISHYADAKDAHLFIDAGWVEI